MASIERRIEAPEDRTAKLGSQEEEGTETRDRLVRKFMQKAIDALARIKRAPIDEERWRYDVEELRSESPVDAAAYVAALACLKHEDEARAIFEARLKVRNADGATLKKLVRLVEDLP